MERELSVALRSHRLAQALHDRGAQRHAGPGTAGGRRRVPGLRRRLPGDARGDRHRESRGLHARRRPPLPVRPGAQRPRRPRAGPRRSDRAALPRLDAPRAWAAAERGARRLRLMTGAPLPLLGTFHEVSFAVLDVRAAVEFYERLGFTPATTTDTLSHPYGVLSDGRLSVGLHQRRGPPPRPSLLPPGIAPPGARRTAARVQLTRCPTSA